MKTEKALRWLIGAAALSGLVWLGGLGWTLIHYFGSNVGTELTVAALQEPEPTNADAEADDDGQTTVTALGDSLTRGTGDPQGKGYVGYWLDELENGSNEKITLQNFGINGQRSDGLLDSLSQPRLQSAVAAADTLVVSIGGNDLFQGGETLGNLDEANIQTIRQTYLANLESTLTKLRETNARADIYLLGLYNPFIEREQTQRTSEIVRQWNFETGELAARYDNVVLVPTYDLFQRNVRNLLAGDQFHPNADGYQLIGSRLADLTKSREAEQ